LQKKKAPELLKVSTELPHVNTASTIPLYPSTDQMKSIEEGKPNEKLTDIHSKLTTLQYQISKIAVSWHGKDHDKEDPFYVTIKDFIRKSEKETEEIEKEHSHSKSQFKELVIAFFLEDKLNQGDFQSHMFFDLINKFLITFDKALQSSELRKMQKKKKVEEKKKREEQAAKKQAERDFYDNKRPESNLRVSQRSLKSQVSSTDRSHWAKGVKNLELGSATILDDVIDDIMADFNAMDKQKKK